MVTNNIHIRPGIPTDLPHVIEIGNNGLGQGYLDECDFLSDGIRWLTVVDDRQPVGFCIADIHSHERATKLLTFPSHLAFNGDRFGYMRTAVVHPDYRGHGLGRTLFTRQFNTLILENPDIIYGRAWHNHDKIPMKGLLTRYGFKHIASIISPWITSPLKCHICNEPSCICHAGLFVYTPDQNDHG